MGAHTPQRFRRTISLGVGVLFLLSLVQVFPGSVRPTPAAAAATYPPVSVFVGYADNLRSSPFFPNPWNGSANTTFVGSPVNGIFDSGAIRIDNPSSSAITVSDVSVDVGSFHYDLWGSNTLPPNGHLILAQTAFAGNYNFDTSDTGNGTCNNDGLIPRVHVTINSLTTTYSDTRQVLNTGGVDLAGCPSGTNESHQWQQVGGGPSVPEMRGGGSPSIRHRTVCHRGRYPVNCATGEFWHSFGDFAIPGRGMALRFIRTYSSLGAGQNGPLGFGWTHSYNMSLAVDSANGNVTVTEETGSQVIFTPTPAGYQPPSRVIAALVKNADGSFTFTRWDGGQFLFSAGGRLLQESDRNGYKTTLAYDGSGNLTSITDPVGRSLSLTYTSGLLTSVGDSSGRSVSFAFDGSSNLTAATDVNGGVTRFTYDANHLMLTMTNPNGGLVTNVYDSTGRITSQTDPMNRTTGYSYTGTGTTVTDPKGNVEVEQFQNNELVSLTKGSGTPQAATWTYAFDPNTLGLTSITDPNSHTWTNSYDASANLISASDPLNRTVSYTYDGLNDVTSMNDPIGISTTWNYDGSGNLLSISRPLTSTSQIQEVTFSYGDSSHPGDVTSVTDPAVKTWSFAYNGSGDLVKAGDPLGNTSTFGYDAVGRPITTVSPKGNVAGANPAAYTSTYSYDPFNDVLKVTDPLGHATSFTYDADGNQTSVTDANGRQTTYTFDAADELTRLTRADGTALSNGYDADGNLTSQVNGLGNAMTYAYNALDRVVSSIDALNRVTSYAYDGSGNLTGLTDAANQLTGYAYDAANQLTGITYSDGKTPNVSYTYDADGRRTAMTDGTGTTTYSYDSLNRLTQSKNGAGQAVAYGYDLADRLTTLTYPNGQVVNRSYDGASRLTSVSDWLGHTANFSYDPNSNLATSSYPNGMQASYSYDAGDQLGGISHSKGSTTVASFSYSRDANGQLTSEISTGVKQPSQNYSYDQVNRLTGVNGSSYGYDAADNITKLISGATLSYDAANQLTTMTRSGVATNFSSDTRGNRVTGISPEGTAATYSYDQANRLTGFLTTPPAAGGLIKGGEYYSLAARNDGTAWAWGYNVFGQLGNGTTTNSSVPVQVSGLVGVTSVAAPAGGMHSLALKNDGTVWAWGFNGFGELGNGTTTNASAPVQVSGLAGATAIAAGNNHSLAVQSDGTMVAWGENAAGELGNGTTTNASTPVPVSGLSGVTAVAGGGLPGSPGHSLALKNDGTVWSWGYDKQGQLGNGSTANALTPVQVSGLSGITAISANGNNSYALKSDGTVWGWGDNSSGQLGNSSAGKTATTPVQVNISGVTGISNGADFGLAVKSDGTAWGWGDDASGQLGDGGACGKACTTPVQVSGLTGVAAVAGGYTHSLAVTTAGLCYGWGQNGEGQLGNGTTTSSSKPVQANNFGPVQRAPAQASYAYDGDGLRASKTVSGVTSRFAWDLGGQVPTLLTDGSASYVYGPGDVPLEQISGSGSVLYYHQDQLGSTRLLTDGSGNVATTYNYDPYGNITGLIGNVGTPLAFAGEYSDAETGFQYLRAREYDPLTAQFVERDPLADLNTHPYIYNADTPLDGTDPTGLWGWGDVTNFFQQNHKKIAEIAGLVALATCWIPVVGEITAVAAVATSAISAYYDIREGDYGGAALDIAGSVLGVGSLVAGFRAARLAVSAARYADAGKILTGVRVWNAALRLKQIKRGLDLAGDALTVYGIQDLFDNGSARNGGRRYSRHPSPHGTLQSGPRPYRPGRRPSSPVAGGLRC